MDDEDPDAVADVFGLDAAELAELERAGGVANATLIARYLRTKIGTDASREMWRTSAEAFDGATLRHMILTGRGRDAYNTYLEAFDLRRTQ